MYQIKNLKKNKLNNAMIVQHKYRSPVPTEMVSSQNGYWTRESAMFGDGDIVVCVGIEMHQVDGHYQRQPFYKVLTLDGTVTYVNKATRQKYFGLKK